MPGMDDDVTAALATLGYDPRWMELGVLSVELLREQVAELAVSDTESEPGAARRATFLGFIRGRRTFTDEQVEHLLVLDRIEAAIAGGIGHEIAHTLAQLAALTDDQFERVAQQEVEVRSFHRIVERERARRAGAP